MKSKLLIIVISLVAFSCAENQKNKDESKPLIEGFWNRIGTIQLVNDVPVDTIYVKDTDPNFKQVKVFKDGNMIWINNQGDSLLPWKGGMGGYGKFKVVSLDSIAELNTNGTGWWGAQVKNYKDSLNAPGLPVGLKTSIEDKVYSQKNFPEAEYAEFWERMPNLEEKSKIDGAWKRVYQIAYVNGIAVDTTSVPSDAVLDVKIMSNGHYTYQVDQTGMAEPDKPQYGGFGGYGTFKYDSKKNMLIEYGEWGSGTSTNMSPPKTNPIIHDIQFYNDDMFLQIGKDTLEVNQSGRGLVYKRIK